VKTEANKDEDFAEDRIKKTTIYKLLEARYDNIDELMKMAMEKASWMERMRSAMEYEWKRNITQHVYNEPVDKLCERLIYYVSFGSNYKPVYDKCMFRYGREKLLKLAKEIIIKYPSDTTMIGKFKDVGREWHG
jgi:hypothetical protein